MKLYITAVAASLLMCDAAQAFDLKSTDLTEGGTLKIDQVSNIFGCKGGNISPEMSWSDPPEGTKSFAVTLYDPDAPTGSGFWHWSAFDIPASVMSLPRGAASSMPAGTLQSKGDAGITGYTGACPPPGPPHRYILTVKALKVEKLGLDATASGALIGFMTNANKLGEASITATYGQ